MESLSDARARPPILSLDGARLRPLRDDDAGALLAYLRDPRVTERTSFPEVTPALVELIITRARRRWASGELGKWALTRDDDDVLIGTCGFNDGAPAQRWAEVAFDLAPSAWGQGLMRRAATRAIAWAFDADLVDRVQAYVRVDNARSIALLERLGFVCEGRARAFRICRGVRHDFFLYGLLRDERRPG